MLGEPHGSVLSPCRLSSRGECRAEATYSVLLVASAGRTGAAHMSGQDIQEAYDRARERERTAKTNFYRLNAGTRDQASLRQLDDLSKARKEWDAAVALVKKLAEKL